MDAKKSTLPAFRLRPVFAFLLAVVLGILVGPSLPLPPFFLLAASILIFAVTIFTLLGARPSLALAFFSLACLLLGAARARDATLPAADDIAVLAAGQPSLWVEGVVESEPEVLPRGALLLTLRVRAIDDFKVVQPSSGGLRLIVSQPDNGSPMPLPGDTLWARGRVELPSGVRNPDGFDEAAFLQRRGIHATLVARRAGDLRREPDASSTAAPWARLAHSLRSAILTALHDHLAPDDAALLGGILLSARAGLPADTSDALARCGALYILSVSGLHLAALAGALALLLTRGFGIPRRIAYLVALAVLWMVVLASGAPLPAVRAGITLTILLLAPLVRRAPDPLHSLAVAALVLLLLNPLTLFDPGAQIAFATIAALLLYLPPLEALIGRDADYGVSNSPLRRTLRRLPTYLFAGFVAQLACTPLVLYYFNLVSLVAPLATTILAPLSVLLLFTGIIACALSPLPAYFSAPLWALNHALLTLLRGLALLFAAPTFAAFPVAAPPLFLLFAFYAALFGFAPLFRRYAFRKYPFGYR